MSFLEMARQKLEKQLQAAAQSRVPPCCGLCEFMAEYEYEGSDMEVCEHEGGPSAQGEPGFVIAEKEPPEWCPRRNGIFTTMVQVVANLERK